MRLRPGLPLLWRGPTQVQVGTDPRWAVVLSDLSASAARALCSVSPGADLRVLRTAFAREEVDVAEVEAVLAHLRSAHLLVGAVPSEESADALAWSVLSADGDGSPVLGHRARATVRVVGLGRCGLLLAGLLAAAGIGTLKLDDNTPVTQHDVGLGGLVARDIGTPRSVAAARMLHDVAPGVRTSTPGAQVAGAGGASASVRSTGSPRRRTTADLVVLVEHGAAEPVRYRRLTDDGVPHLGVVLREASALVGPLVLPRRSPCLWCVDLHRADRDPHWPVLATQLVGPGGPVVPEETSLAAVVAAQAAAQVLAHVDGRPGLLLGTSLEVRLPDLEPRRMTWPAHPRCDCAAYLAAESNPASASEPTGAAGRPVVGPVQA